MTVKVRVSPSAVARHTDRHGFFIVLYLGFTHEKVFKKNATIATIATNPLFIGLSRVADFFLSLNCHNQKVCILHSRHHPMSVKTSPNGIFVAAVR